MHRRTFVRKSAAAAAIAMAAPWTWGREHHDQDVVRYPDPAIVTLDPRFDKYRQFNAAVERLWTGARWAEGPVWFGDGGFLLFSDIPNNRILRWTEASGAVDIFRRPSHYTNGNTRDRQGRLVSCEHDSRRVTRTEYDGTITVLIDRYQGKRLNAPNDVVVHSNGSIWFTDPGYGILSDYEGHVDTLELPTNVYRIDPEKHEASAVASDLARPNGLCFSPDERQLYVADTGQTPDKPRPISVFDLIDGQRLKNGRLFCDMGKARADGIRCDVDGNVWAATGEGVQVFTPDGKLIGKILLPEVCANLCFGGAKRNRLFMTASQSLYALYVNTRGAQVP